MLVAGLISTVVGISTFAYAAANTTPTSKVGDGAAAISGYTITAVSYTLNGADPTDIDQVAFTLSSAPPGVPVIKAKLVSAGADWYTCANVAADVPCDTTAPQAMAATANELRVVVSQ